MRYWELTEEIIKDQLLKLWLMKEEMKNIFLIVPYFFGYKTEFFFFQNKPKDLDPSYKTDLDLWDCLGRVNWYYSKIS